MKISLDITKQASIIKAIATLASQMASPEYLAFVYISIEGTSMTLKASDLSVSKIAKIQLDQEYPSYTVLIHHSALLNMLSIMSGKVYIDFSAHEIKQGSTKLKFSVIAETNVFPTIEDFCTTDEHPIWSESEIVDLKKAIDICSPCIETSGTRPRLSGILFNSVDSSLYLTSTDGHRLARVKLDKTSYMDMDALIPLKAIKHIQAFLATTAFPIIYMQGSELVLSDSIQAMSVRLIDEAFPDVKSIIPKKDDSFFSFTISDNLKLACKNLLKLSSQGSLRLQYDEQKRLALYGDSENMTRIFEFIEDDFSENSYESIYKTSYLTHAISYTDRAYQKGSVAPLVCESADDKILMLVMCRRA